MADDVTVRGYPAPPCAFRPEYHRPRLYLFRTNRGLRIIRNRYVGRDGSATIGLTLVTGTYAYCVKWAEPRVVKPGEAR